MFRFVHSADLHLGKPFGQFPPDLAAELRRARLDSLGRLAEAARAHDAGVVALAGDVWDAAEPDPAHLRKALDAMAEADDLLWALLPGNHDPHRPGGLWERLKRDAPQNIRPLLDAAPVELTPGVFALPAPCLARASGLDPTAAMDAMATPEGALRLGLAHGPVVGFDEDGGADVIDPGRAERAGLDYLALGDWHGAMRVGPRCWYAGTPEPDRFKDDATGVALAVTLPHPGAAPVVERVATGRFRWVKATLDLTPGALWAPMLRAVEPPEVPRRDLLLSLTLEGELSLPERTALDGFLESFAQGLAHLATNRTGLSTRRALSDLDQIAVGGPLRAAAEGLLADAGDAALEPSARMAAQEALDLLYALSAGESGERRS
jgi:hypothetical protein